MSAFVKPWFGHVIWACVALLIPVIVLIVEGHSLGDGGVTLGGTEFEVIAPPKKEGTPLKRRPKC